MRYPRIIGHRCGGRLAAENSLAGLAAAARLGCRAVEFDVMLCADGVPVLMHDETVDRTTDGQGAVAALTLDQLRRCRLGGEAVPTLAEALARCADLGLWANIELKAPAGREAATGRAVARHLAGRWPGPGVVSSFAPAALAACRQEAADLPLALLYRQPPADWPARLRALGAVALHCAARYANRELIAASRAAGIPLACYTVNARAAAERLLTAGVSAVFTDRPELWAAEEM